MTLRSAAARTAHEAPPPSTGCRKLSFSVGSYSADAHTCEAVLSTGARVARFWGDEELEISAEAIDLGRAPYPLLDSHQQGSIDAVLGTITDIRIAGGKLIGTIKFGETDAAQKAEGMVARGELTGVSIGYQVSQWTITEEDGARTVYRATRWTPLEASLVAVPADNDARIRSAANNSITETEGEHDMHLTRSAPGNPANPTPPPVPALDRFTPSDTLAFVEVGRRFGIETEARALIDLNTAGTITTEAARMALLKKAADYQRAATAGLNGTGAVVQVTRDEGDTSRRAVKECLESLIQRRAPSEIARPWRNMGDTLLRNFFLAIGDRDGAQGTPYDLAKRAMTTSDFSNILVSAMNNSIIELAEKQVSPWESIAVKNNQMDFKGAMVAQMSSVPTLRLILEGGEIKNTYLYGTKQAGAIYSYADIIKISFQLLVNEGALYGFFADLADQMVKAGVRRKCEQFVAMLTANSGNGPTLTDGNPLFHASHANIAGNNAAPSVIGFDIARQLAWAQKDNVGTLTPVDLKYILTPPGVFGLAEAAVAAITATKEADVNIFANKLTPLVEPRLTGTAWYAFADPAQAPVFQYGYLDGHEGVQVEQKEGWDTLGVEWRAVMHFGCWAVDHRGAVKNPGA